MTMLEVFTPYYLSIDSGYSMCLSGRDCRNPEAKDSQLDHILVAWIPAVHAGMTGYFYGL